MTTGDEVAAAMAVAEAAEQAREAAFAPTGAGDPGETLAGGDLSVLDMSPAAEVPDRGPLTSFPGWSP